VPSRGRSHRLGWAVEVGECKELVGFICDVSTVEHGSATVDRYKMQVSHPIGFLPLYGPLSYMYTM
jgi:hypothetical protein